MSAASTSLLVSTALGLSLLYYGPKYLDYERVRVIPNRGTLNRRETASFPMRTGRWPKIEPKVVDLMPGLAYLVLGMDEPFARATALRGFHEQTGMRLNATDLYVIDGKDGHSVLFGFKPTPEECKTLAYKQPVLWQPLDKDDALERKL